MEVQLDKDKSKKILKVENTIYAYSKFRSSYGRWCSFHDHDTEVNIDIQPDENVSKMYEKMGQIERGTQACPQISYKEINTSHIKNTTTGVNHVEGGWPKDISYLDQEQTIRYRKKAEREELYIPTMQNLCKLMEECIEQNNSIDIYVRYFAKEPILDYHPEVSATVAINMRDPSGQNRAVSCLSWHPVDSAERILVAHCDLDFMEVMKPCNDSYIWWIENPFQPEHVLSATSPMLTMESNYKDINLIAGGQHNGQVVFFDIRKSVKPIGLTEKPVSHLEPVHSLIWIQSKTGFECFTTSTDGQVLWWDMRNLTESTDQMVIDHTKNNDMETSEGGVVLEYCNTVPTKFMVGTEKGNVYSCTRKAKTPADKLGQAYSEHIGPIYLLQRNPYLYKLFLTVGDYHADIWAEDFAHAPIWKTPLYNTHVLHGGWSPPRPSVFFLTKADGTFDVWDLMYRQKGPEYSLKLSDKRLFCMSVQERGEFVAVGSETGTTYVLQMSSEVFEPQSGERTFFANLIERESRREKFLYDKEKDRKLAKIGRSSQPQEISKEMEDIKEILEKTSDNFFETIAEEMKRLEKYRKYPQSEVIFDRRCEEEDSAEEMVFVEAPARIMPEDRTLPLYQAESFALESTPDEPMDIVQGTIFRKRFKIGHCADIPYPPSQDIDFKKLTTCDCPALMPSQSLVDQEVIREPVITRIEPGRVFIDDFKEPPQRSPARAPSRRATVKASADVVQKKIYLDDISISTGGDNESWEQMHIRRARVEDSVDITSLGFRDSQAHTGVIIGGLQGMIKLGTEAPAAGDSDRRSSTSGLQAARLEEGLHGDTIRKATVKMSQAMHQLPALAPVSMSEELDSKGSVMTRLSKEGEFPKSMKKSSLRSDTKKLSLPPEDVRLENGDETKIRRRTIQFKAQELTILPEGIIIEAIRKPSVSPQVEPAIGPEGEPSIGPVVEPLIGLEGVPDVPIEQKPLIEEEVPIQQKARASLSTEEPSVYPSEPSRQSLAELAFQPPTATLLGSATGSFLPPSDTKLSMSMVEPFQPPGESKQSKSVAESFQNTIGTSLRTSVDLSDKTKRVSMTKDVVGEALSAHTVELAEEAEQALLDAITEYNK